MPNLEQFYRRDFLKVAGSVAVGTALFPKTVLAELLKGTKTDLSEIKDYFLTNTNPLDPHHIPYPLVPTSHHMSQEYPPPPQPAY